MKIARIIARLNVGGPARHVVWLTEALQDGEFQSVLLAGTVPDTEEDMNWFAAEHGVEPYYIQEMSRELSPKDAVSLWKVYKKFKREQPNIIHTHTAKAGTVGRAAGFFYRWLTWKTLVGKPRRVKFVHTYHGHVFHSYYGRRKTQIFLSIEKTLARLATDKIIVISNQQYREIHEQFGVGRTGQFQVVPPVRFVSIGDGHLRESLEREAADLNVEDVVQFLGNRNDTDVFYAGLDLVALTSHNEGTPLSLIEAMANSRSVISTTVGGVVDLVGETIEENENCRVCERGVRVAPNDAEAFYKGLVHLVTDDKLRNESGARGKIFVASSYSKERLVTDIKNLYRDLLREKG